MKQNILSTFDVWLELMSFLSVVMYFSHHILHVRKPATGEYQFIQDLRVINTYVYADQNHFGVKP